MNTVLVEKRLPSNQTIQIVQGDITAEEVDAIVNAANEYLQHGGGVARTISKRSRMPGYRNTGAFLMPILRGPQVGACLQNT